PSIPPAMLPMPPTPIPPPIQALVPIPPPIPAPVGRFVGWVPQPIERGFMIVGAALVLIAIVIGVIVGD
ncbi:MAG: hypothetical protein WKG01_41220, partial [Kofleriaceae bacterium]